MLAPRLLPHCTGYRSQDLGRQIKLCGGGVQDMKQGGLETIRDSIRRATQSLSSAQYSDIDVKYRSQQIDLRTTEMATSDLEKYHKVARLPG